MLSYGNDGEKLLSLGFNDSLTLRLRTLSVLGILFALDVLPWDRCGLLSRSGEPGSWLLSRRTRLLEVLMPPSSYHIK